MTILLKFIAIISVIIVYFGTIVVALYQTYIRISDDKKTTTVGELFKETDVVFYIPFLNTFALIVFNVLVLLCVIGDWLKRKTKIKELIDKISNIKIGK